MRGAHASHYSSEATTGETANAQKSEGIRRGMLHRHYCKSHSSSAFVDKTSVVNIRSSPTKQLNNNCSVIAYLSREIHQPTICITSLYMIQL